jgi:hypothetical protein
MSTLKLMIWTATAADLPNVGWLEPGEEFRVDAKVADGLIARGVAKAKGSKKKAKRAETEGDKP